MRNPDRQTTFRFKQFEVSNCKSAMKVGTDGVLLGAWAFDDVKPEDVASVLDVGCGTGLLSLMMAQRFDKARVSAIDIDQAAADEALYNFSSSNWSDRLYVECCGLEEFSSDGVFDAIICNPPFFTSGELSPDKERSVARHETSLTLELLLGRCSSLLSERGRMAIVTAAENCERINFIAALNHLAVIRLCHVYTKETKPSRRILCELCRAGERAVPMRSEQFVIHDRGGVFSKEYIRLVSPFYIKF